MNELLEALANSFVAILAAIAQFDIMAVDPQRLAFAAQIIADTARILVNAVSIFRVVTGV